MAVRIDLSLALDDASPEPLFRQIHDRIAGAVLDGRLAPGARLPSARSLAAQLSIARGTVDAAYQLLAGEGYIVARGARGTLIDPALDRRLLKPARTETRTAPVAIDPTPASSLPLFRMGVPALDAFPHKAWSRLIARRARTLRPVDHGYQPPAGDEHLRLQVARYLAVARGVSCTPAQILITNGYQGALGLITRALLKPGDRVWLEHPGYPNVHEALRLAGMQLLDVPVDAEGFDVAWAVAKARPARIAFVTPTHQYPLGVTLSLQRRMALLKWAEATGGWIVEDDYDSEFRYHGKPLPALKSLDRSDRVLYVGTFSKVLAPGLRVGYLVAPAALVEQFTSIAAALQPPPNALIQSAIADFLEQGQLARHIRRMRALYAERRAALAEALGELIPALEIELKPGGMHLLARLPHGTDDVKLVAHLKEAVMAPSALSTCGVQRRYAPGLVIGFTNVARRKAMAAVQALAAAMRNAR
ncbi:MAG TPA: PLP-dependent aminotransferase family protein [Dongiaceae bacterium]|jgi:GntR family transcriptional regulator/MocR family aminotransferase|nr:PLP-dependent aminotransferase family protein [Dongiaceae bacterium]